jgi:pimeloyl-ACP methyl ester carboxylesterase
MTLDIHYTETGKGPPLVLLHAGLMSTEPAWNGHPGSYATYMDQLAARFRVIRPDTRGHGKTPNPSGRPPTYTQLADDVITLIDTLGLDRPLLCGFSDGGMIATVAALRAPSKVRAVVNDAGFDILIPRMAEMLRRVFGGSPDASKANPDAFAAMLAHDPHGFVRRLQDSHGGAWRTVVEQIFVRLTNPGYTIDDLRGMSIPILVLSGDRDFTGPVEDVVAIYRALGKTAELAIVPNLDHTLSQAAIAPTIEFLQRHSSSHHS